MSNDMELLRRYVEERAEGPFTELVLTSGQADQASAALYQVWLDRSTGKARSGAKDEVEDFVWWSDQKTKALEPILTPTQLESFRKINAAQAKSVRDIYSKMQDSSGAK